MIVSRPARRFLSPLLVLALLSPDFGASVSAQETPATYPATPRRPVTDTYAGTAGPVKVTDDYRWLENLDDTVVKDWITLQNAATRRTLDALPSRAVIRDELRRLIGNAPVTRNAPNYAGGKLFMLKRQPPKNQPMLVVMDDPDAVDGERVVLDPNLRNDKGTTAIDWFVPSHDGRLVAVSLSDNGSEKGTLRFFDAANGNELSDVVPRVQNPTAGGSVAWDADNAGVWYTRYPAPMERPAGDEGFYQQVYFHKLGTRSIYDTKSFGDGLPRIAEIALSATDDGRHVLASVANGDGGDYGFWLRGSSGEWRRLADFGEGYRSATFGRDGRIYAIALNGSPRGRIVAMKFDAPTLSKATTVVPQSDAVVEDIAPTATRLYVEALVGGPSEIRVYSLSGRPMPAPAVEAVSSATIGTRLAGDAILFGNESFVTPFAWYRLDPKRAGGKASKTSLSALPQDIDTSEFQAIRRVARSRDGTAIPVSVVARKDVGLDGTHPALLTGYGGFGAAERPYFSRRVLFWLRHGGVFAQANLRGGSEFGEEWHGAGNLTKKQNVFDDFAAAARMLIADNYTSAGKLAIEGGSNGGLLMGAQIVQHPELYGAVVAHVGIHDMLRVELTPNGAFNITEFGTVKEPAQFDALYGYSPFHHVVDGTAYPPVLLTTGLNDGRVDPWQTLKMTARLQAANRKGRTVLMRVASDAGHGFGTSLSSSIEQDADTFAFLFDSLGMTPDAPAAR